MRRPEREEVALRVPDGLCSRLHICGRAVAVRGPQCSRAVGQSHSESGSEVAQKRVRSGCAPSYSWKPRATLSSGGRRGRTRGPCPSWMSAARSARSPASIPRRRAVSRTLAESAVPRGVPGRLRENSGGDPAEKGRAVVGHRGLDDARGQSDHAGVLPETKTDAGSTSEGAGGAVGRDVQ